MVRLGIGFEGSLRFYTPEECDEWLHTRERLKPDEVPDAQVERVDYPLKPHQVFFVAHWIAQSLTFRMPTLLWLTEWGIWPSSENWHLYYRLRQTYGDQRLLHEAPGHLFLEHESEDLASLLQVAMLNGWGGYILTQAHFVNAFFSHDEFIDFFAKRDGSLDGVRKGLEGRGAGAGLPPHPGFRAARNQLSNAWHSPGYSSNTRSSPSRTRHSKSVPVTTTALQFPSGGGSQ